MTEDVKPSYSLSMKGFGTLGYFLFFIGFAISFIMYFQYGEDLTIFFMLQVMAIIGAFMGRILEGNHHKRIMSHMTLQYQSLYRKMARALHDHDKKVGDIEIVKCKGCGCDTMVSKLDEHLCQKCLEQKDRDWDTPPPILDLLEEN